MIHLSCRTLTPVDAERMVRLLTSCPPDYSRYFHPFPFDLTSIRHQLEKAKKDLFVGLEAGSELAGFYMLRGLDEGYAEPMYGVFIGHGHQGKGLARFTLIHAECFCKLNNFRRLLLKVHPDNNRAKKLYEAQGYVFLREEPANHNIVLGKDV